MTTDYLIIAAVSIGAMIFLAWIVKETIGYAGPRRIYRTEPDGTKTLIGWTD